jgi:hypothetical protein
LTGWTDPLLKRPLNAAVFVANIIKSNAISQSRYAPAIATFRATGTSRTSNDELVALLLSSWRKKSINCWSSSGSILLDDFDEFDKHQLIGGIFKLIKC